MRLVSELLSPWKACYPILLSGGTRPGLRRLPR